MKRISLVILISLLFLSMLNTGLLSQEKKNSTFKYTKISSFEIKLTNSTTIGLQDYTNKPIVLNWGASWCPICKANLVTMNNIYDSAKPYFNFLTVSYGGSGDKLNDIIGLKNIGPYGWDFGLDSSDAASTFKVTNGYLWILNTNLELVAKWNYTIVPQDQLVNAMNNLLSSTVIQSGSNKTSTSQPLISGTGSVSFLFLLNNPLFLIFGGFITLGIITLVVLHFYPRRK